MTLTPSWNGGYYHAVLSPSALHNTVDLGDNLDVLRALVADASFDLVHIDPPMMRALRHALKPIGPHREQR